MSIFTHDLHVLTGCYVLDALDGKELDRFERHLHRCRQCASEVRGLSETATRIALAATLRPPTALKEQVLTAATRTRQLPPVTDQRSRPQVRAFWLPRLAMVAAAVVLLAAVVVLGISRISAQHQLSRAQAQYRAAAAVLAAPDARLVSGPASTGGTVTAVLSHRLRETLITSADLPRLTQAKVYELWYLGAAGGARRIGLLPAPESGRTAPVLAHGLERGDKIGLTVEPPGGTSKPTTPPIVVLSVRA